MWPVREVAVEEYIFRARQRLSSLPLPDPASDDYVVSKTDVTEPCRYAKIYGLETSRSPSQLPV